MSVVRSSAAASASAPRWPDRATSQPKPSWGRLMAAPLFAATSPPGSQIAQDARIVARLAQPPIIAEVGLVSGVGVSAWDWGGDAGGGATSSWQPLHRAAELLGNQGPHDLQAQTGSWRSPRA